MQQKCFCIGSMTYQLISREFFDGLLSMELPSDFSIMTVEKSKTKYPSTHRPEIIYSNEDGSVNLTLTITQYLMQKEDVENAIKGFHIIIKRMYPANTIHEMKCAQIEDLLIGSLSFCNHAMDGDLYVIMFVTCIDSKLLLGTFSAPHQQQKEWKNPATQMIRSIKEQKKGGFDV